jgi:hypothetical protein
MLFDIILAKFLFDRKLSNNNIIFIIALFHIIMYFILYKTLFMPMVNSISAILLVLAVFVFFFSYRIFALRRYLKSLIN